MPFFFKETFYAFFTPGKRYPCQTSVKNLLYFSGDRPVKKNPASRFGPSGRLQQTQSGFAAPVLPVEMLQNKNFNFTPALLATKNPCGNHPGIVYHQKITGSKKGRQFKKPAIRKRTCRTIHPEQFGMIPFVSWKLCDTVFRQTVVIMFCFQHWKHIKARKVYKFNF